MADTIDAYPIGTMLRAVQICTIPAKLDAAGQVIKPARRGLLPINLSTWYRWVKIGLVPKPLIIGQATPVWPIEAVMACARRSDNDDGQQAA